MQLANPFTQETRNLYLYRYDCSDCGRSDQGLSLHHIRGRISASPFNACLLCDVCHSRCNHNQEEERKYFALNAKFLHYSKYKPTEEDLEFIKDNFERLNIKQVMDKLCK